MNKIFINQWDKNKQVLRNYFKTTNQSEYSEYIDIVKALFKYCITTGEFGYEKWNTDDIIVLKGNGCEGDILFIINEVEQYSLGDSVLTGIDYGSCSGCDTLMRIRSINYENDEGLPTKEQIDQYMLVCLHLVQKLRYLIDKNETFYFDLEEL